MLFKDKTPRCPTHNEVSEVLELLQNLAFFSSQGEEMQNTVLKLQTIVQKDTSDKKETKTYHQLFCKECLMFKTISFRYDNHILMFYFVQ